MSAHKFKFSIDLERVNGSVSYEVECEVSPGDPGCHTQRNGDPGWPSEGPDVEVKEVWYVSKHQCPYCIRAAKTDPKCERCHGKGTVTTRERREELDELVTDDEVLEQSSLQAEADYDDVDGSDDG